MPSAQTELPQPSGLSRRHFLKISGAFALLATWDFSRPPQAFAGLVGVNASNYHFLNRITYGVTAAELQRVGSMGQSAYLEEQLFPERMKKKGDIKVSPILNKSFKALRRIDDPWNAPYMAFVEAMVDRAVSSPAQLRERMVEFWSDHFNVAADELIIESIEYQRAAIRPNAFGTFRDLLLATAKSQAMLYYLDNAYSVAEHPNENYAREVLELHTMGVDGGYTETDVRELARALTGWTTNWETGAFVFADWDHDKGAKRVLGKSLPAGRGIEDGMDILNYLANHPSTANFVCRKLCVRFVSDQPPAALISRMASTWLSTGGDIKAILRVMFLSSEFAAAAGQKLRRPLDFAIGALRATGTTFTDFWTLYYGLSMLGQVPYDWDPPNGYPDVGAAWLNSNGLLARWTVAQFVTQNAYWEQVYNKRKGTMKTPLISLLGKPENAGALVDRVATLVFGAPVDGELRDSLVSFASAGTGASAPVSTALLNERGPTLFGLALSSPAFQWR